MVSKNRGCDLLPANQMKMKTVESSTVTTPHAIAIQARERDGLLDLIE